MENFVIYNPVKVHFGRGCLEKLHRSLERLGTKAMLIYGGGSIKGNGIYDDVIEQLKKSGISFVEFYGIRPNPIVEDVDRAAALARSENVDVILAVGGGSVIDSAKVLSVAIHSEHGAWSVAKGDVPAGKAVPLLAVLTLAATGTEMNRFAVVQNNNTQEKIGFMHSNLYPVESFLDPVYTFTVPKNYTGYGIVDLMAHCLEAYFGEGEATLSDGIVFAILKEALVNGELLLDDLNNYKLRERIMYAATMALNNLTGYGRKNGDWGVHALGHILSVLYDTPHGAALSIVYPAWLKHFRERLSGRISLLGTNLFDADSVDKTIFELESFFVSMESPIRLSDINIGGDQLDEILNLMIESKPEGNHISLNESDYRGLIDLMK